MNVPIKRELKITRWCYTNLLQIFGDRISKAARLTLTNESLSYFFRIQFRLQYEKKILSHGARILCVKCYA